jgi:ATP-dependent DNA helicase RecG
MWLTAEEIRALKRTKAGTLIERSITNFTVDDIDQTLFQRFREKLGIGQDRSDIEILLENDLAVKDRTGNKLTLSACLLFGRKPMLHFHDRCGVNFRKYDGLMALTGTKNNERLDKTIEEPLPLLIEKVFELIQLQIGKSHKLIDLFFEEKPEYPTFAWQEAIINAVAHRDYSYRGNDIEIRMFDDRLEIRSPGLPPEPVTIDELRQRKPVHASRNPRIMRALKTFGFVRERGEGIPRIFEETQEACLPEPEILAEGNFFKIILWNTQIFDQETMNWIKQFPIKELNANQRRILAYSKQSGKNSFALRDYIHENKMGKEIAKKEIQNMVNLGIIQVAGKRKGTYYYPMIKESSVEDKLQIFFAHKEYLKNSDFRTLMGTSDRLSAMRSLKILVEKGILRKEGKGKGTRYFLVSNSNRNQK